MCNPGGRRRLRGPSPISVRGRARNPGPTTRMASALAGRRKFGASFSNGELSDDELGQALYPSRRLPITESAAPASPGAEGRSRLPPRSISRPAHQRRRRPWAKSMTTYGPDYCSREDFPPWPSASGFVNCTPRRGTILPISVSRIVRIWTHLYLRCADSAMKSSCWIYGHRWPPWRRIC
jgi:hypothetical protein